MPDRLIKAWDFFWKQDPAKARVSFRVLETIFTLLCVALIVTFAFKVFAWLATLPPEACISIIVLLLFIGLGITIYDGLSKPKAEITK